MNDSDPCLLCGALLDAAPVVGTKARHGHDSRRVACVECGLVQLSPRPSPEALGALYASHAYREEHGPVPLHIGGPDGSRVVQPSDPAYPDALLAMGRYRVRWLHELAGVKRPCRVLEVGSGDGYVLRALTERGHDVTGVEPDQAEAAASVERCPQARVYAGQLGEVCDALEGPFDAIVSYHVLEHFLDPRAALATMRDLLADDGVLALEVPNVQRPGLPLTDHWQHVHITDFSRATLGAMLAREGFSVRWGDDAGQLRVAAVKSPRIADALSGQRGVRIAELLATLDPSPLAAPSEPAEPSPLQAFLDGMDPMYLDEERMRAEVIALLNEARLAADNHDAACDMLAHWAKQAQANADALFGGWDPDPFVRGMMHGEGYAWMRAQGALSHIGNAMRMAEHAHDARLEAITAPAGGAK